MRIENHHHHHHAEEKLCSEKRERSVRLLISGFFTRKKKRSSPQESSEDSRLMRRNKANNFHLSLSQIMRKLKLSFKKEKPQHDKRLLGEKRRFQRSLSTTKDHFFLERMTSISQNRSQQEHHEHVKHLSEMFNNGNSDQSLSTSEEAQRRIVSLPEYSSPFRSPGRRWDQNSTVLSRSASDESITINDASSSQGSSPSISKTNQIDDNIFTFEISKVEADDREKETSYEESLQQLSLLSVDSQSHYVSRTEEYSLALEPLFIEHEISPNRGEAKRQQLCNQLEEKKTVFKYVKAVLDARESSWEEMYLKTEISDQILNPALISNIPFYQTRLCADHDLLFDCINELLLEFCGFPQWVSFVKPRTQVLSFSAEVMVHQVQKEVYSRLFPLQISHSLDQIFRQDMAKPTTWLDVRCDVESIGFETSDMILNELLEQLMLDL